MAVGRYNTGGNSVWEKFIASGSYLSTESYKYLVDGTSDTFRVLMSDDSKYNWAHKPGHDTPDVGYKYVDLDITDYIYSKEYVPYFDTMKAYSSSFIFYSSNHGSRQRYNVILAGGGGGGGPSGTYWPNTRWGGGGGGGGGTLIATGVYIVEGSTAYVGGGGGGGSYSNRYVPGIPWGFTVQDYTNGGGGGTSEINSGTNYRISAYGGGGGNCYNSTMRGSSAYGTQYDCNGGSGGSCSYGPNLNVVGIKTRDGGSGGRGVVEYFAGGVSGTEGTSSPAITQYCLNVNDGSSTGVYKTVLEGPKADTFVSGGEYGGGYSSSNGRGGHGASIPVSGQLSGKDGTSGRIFIYW